MPDKPLRPCRYPGCTALVASGYCSKHQPKTVDQRSADAKKYRRLYKLPQWQMLRDDQLIRCPWCQAPGCNQRATDVDHIRDHKGDLDLFFDPGNLQSLCHRCHSRKTASENPSFLRRKNRKK